MDRGVVVVSLVASAVAVTVAGCAADGPAEVTRHARWARAEALHLEPFTVDIVTREGSRTVRGYSWGAGAGPDAVLAISGIGGGARAAWGPLAGLPGYSLAHRFVDAGIPFYTIDLPGYGGSSTLGTTSVDMWMQVIDDVASALRDGRLGEYDHVVGIGWSMGAILVSSGQGAFGSFDAIVLTGFTPDGVRDDAVDCLRDADTCPPRQELLFHAPNADPAVVYEMLWGRGDFDAPPVGAAGTFGMAGCTGCLVDGGPAVEPNLIQLLAGEVEVPVLQVIGDHDFFFPPEAVQDDASWYGMTDVEILFLQDTGHAPLHHLNHDDVMAQLVSWTADRLASA